jgi:hypothetical protein
MTDTPETDGITFYATKDMMPPYNTVPAAFSSKLELERNEAREIAQDLLEKNAKQAVNLVKWRECAERLAGSISIAPLIPTNSMESALAEFERLREASK